MVSQSTCCRAIYRTLTKLFTKWESGTLSDERAYNDVCKTFVTFNAIPTYIKNICYEKDLSFASLSNPKFICYTSWLPQPRLRLFIGPNVVL